MQPRRQRLLVLLPTHTVKVTKGKHSFSVRAVDQAGNVGAPATDAWKVKKKKRKT